MLYKKLFIYLFFYLFWFFIIYLSNFINNYLIMSFFVLYIIIFKLLRKNIFKHEYYIFKHNKKINTLFGYIDYCFLTPYEVYKYRVDIKKNDICFCFEEKDLFSNKNKNIIYPFLQPFSNFYDVLSSGFARITVGDFTFLKSWLIHIIIVYFLTFFIINFSKISLLEYILIGVYPAAVLYNYYLYFIQFEFIKKIIVRFQKKLDN